MLIDPAEVAHECHTSGGDRGTVATGFMGNLHKIKLLKGRAGRLLRRVHPALPAGMENLRAD